jgi:hypothetical protein
VRGAALAALLLAAAGPAACGRLSRAPRDSGLALRALGSVRLQESDTLYLGAPSYLGVGPGGDVWVSDAMNGAVVRFARSGAPVRRYGRRGDGPGEFHTPVASAVVGDTLLAVADWGRLRIALFDLRTGAYLRAVRAEGLPFWMQVAGDTVWIADLNHRRGTSFATWSGGSDSLRYAGPLPAEYLRTPLLFEAHPYGTLARAGGRLLIGFTGHPAIFVAQPGGGVIDSVRVPVLRRRGVPDDMERRFSRQQRNETIASMVSALMAIQPLSSGNIALVHFDITVREGQITAQPYVSVLSADLRRACVDAPLASSSDARPAVAFRGDTLLVLDQRVTSATRSATFIRRFRIDTSACHWLPTTKHA